MKKIIYFDMDGVLADYEGKASYKDNPEREATGFFVDLEPIEGAIEAFKKLSEHYDCYILTTAPWSSPVAWGEKRLWVEKHLGDFGFKRLMTSHRKDLHIGDYLIDDRTVNGAGEFKGIHVHFGTPEFPNWNKVVEYFETERKKDLMKKKIVIFSGAGVSRESGVLTFRDCKDGLWNNHKIEDVATPEGWRRNRETVLNFYNERRRQMPEVQPNDAHIAIAELEKDFDVTVVTQNVDDLHERAGSTNIIHLHGELTKARGALYHHKPSPVDHVVDIGYNDINIGDKCPVTDSQLRPHIVWFGEYPFGVDEATIALREADILLIVGTSLQIGYTLNLLNQVRHDGDTDKPQCEIYYVDPEPMHYMESYGLSINYVRKGAVEGVRKVIDLINSKETV